MKKIFQRIGVLLILIVSITVTIKMILRYTNLEPIKAFFNHPAPAVPSPKKLLPVKIPDLPTLAMQQEGIAAPTPAQINEENQIIANQVATAGQWLSSPDAQQRHNGAEQLSAYPTPKAEIMLLKTLSSDTDPAVRTAAAESLSVFESLSNTAILALLAAMDDSSESVQISVLSTLENQLSKEENTSKRYQAILRGLKKQVKSTHLSEEMRNAVRGFIEDQQP